MIDILDTLDISEYRAIKTHRPRKQGIHKNLQISFKPVDKLEKRNNQHLFRFIPIMESKSRILLFSPDTLSYYVKVKDKKIDRFRNRKITNDILKAKHSLLYPNIGHDTRDSIDDNDAFNKVIKKDKRGNEIEYEIIF